jgi:hypothetical protein
LGEGGAKTKFRDNIAALKTLQRLRETGAAPTIEDQKILVRYVGWGGLPQAFDLENQDWKAEAEELRQLLEPHDYAQARRSTQDAHYTSQEVVQGLYDGLLRLGFQGPAHILEPSAGIGHFRGLMPKGLRSSPHSFLAVELDPLTAAIGAALYPDASFLNQGFQEVEIPPGHFDLALGNPPFGNQKIYDPQYPNFGVHNFFMAKSIDTLRPGGLAAFVVSRYFLDAVNNPAREFIAERANFLGAVRLPNNAFKKNALTEVTTDIVFFQRTEQPELNPAWLRTGKLLDEEGQEITVNQYYLDNPGQMIGRMAMTQNMFRGVADLLPPPNMTDIHAEIVKRLEALPQRIYQARPELEINDEKKPDANLDLCKPLKVDAFFITNEGRLAQRRANLLKQPRYEVFEPKNKKAGERIRGLIKIRNILTDLMASELSDDTPADDLAYTGWELDATGVGYKLNSRFAKFQNMPELINLYRTVGDVITKKDLEVQNQGRSLVPKIRGGKPLNLVVERSPLQAEYMGIQSQAVDEDGRPRFAVDGKPVMDWNKGSIIYRMENLPKDPKKDNPLCITNDARKAGLDYRLIDPLAPDFAGSKVNVAADRIFQTWQEWQDEKGTQLVFCDLSTPKLGRKSIQELTGDISHEAVLSEIEPEEIPVLSMDDLLAEHTNFSVYDDLKSKLVAKGIPAQEIRFIHECQTDIQKAKLFDEVNQGRVRVLMGSTAKMGAGMNVQKRLVALHHLDAPWRPSDLEQREGRIIRQGNMFFERDPEGFEIEIIRYATKQTYDSRMWQTIEGKAIGIEQFRKGDSLARVIEDVAGEAANAAEMKAAATGNELIFLQVKLASELKKMEAVQANFQRGQHQLERRVAWLEKYPEQAAKEITGWHQEIELRNKNTTQEKFFAVEGKIYGEKNRNDLLVVVGRAMKDVVARPEQTKKVGLYRGFQVHVEAFAQGCQFVLEGKNGLYNPLNLSYQKGDEFSIHGFIQRMDNFMNKFEANIEEVEKEKRQKPKN